VKNLFAEQIKQRLDNLPLETITPQILNNILLEAHYDVVVKFVE
jgi:hypothetical protein